MKHDFNTLLAALEKNPEEFLFQFRNQTVVQEIRGLHNETLLHFCAVEGMLACVKALLKLGSNPNVRNKYGGTPLMDAALLGHKMVVEVLLTANADTEARDDIGDTVLDKLELLERYSGISKLIEDTKRNRRKLESGGKT